MRQAFQIAFSMYSAIPMPRTDWTEKNMRYALCFFPLVGIPVGGIVLLWLWAAQALSFGAVVTGAVCAVLPALITGGIHLDGFCDTMDALGSHQPREKKLEILKDSHAGAFALLGAAGYFLLDGAFWSEFGGIFRAAGVVCIGFVLARALSALAAVRFSPARKNGLLRTFTDSARVRAVTVSSAVYSVLCAVGMVLIDWRLALAALVCAGGSFLFYHRMSRREFGGVTGDLAGFFVTVCELVMLIGVAVVQKLIG